MRGSGTAAAGSGLLAALGHGHGVVPGQADVEAKTNEIPMFSTLLAQADAAYLVWRSPPSRPG
jgi:hypothetical protein